MGIGMLFWVMALGFLVWAVSKGSFGSWHRSGMAQGKESVALLKERYARGEIDEAEFQRIKKQLEER